MKSLRSHHFEVYLNYRGIGWFIAGYRETLPEAEAYLSKLLSDDNEYGQRIKDSIIKRKRNREQFISVSL